MAKKIKWGKHTLTVALKGGGSQVFRGVYTWQTGKDNSLLIRCTNESECAAAEFAPKSWLYLFATVEDV